MQADKHIHGLPDNSTELPSEEVATHTRPPCAAQGSNTGAPLAVASLDFVELVDSQGVLLLVPAAVLNHYRALGLTTLHFDISIGDNPARSGWLTVTQAARQHLHDVDGITLSQATAKISRACDTQRILASGHGRDRRIEPTSLQAWRLAQREKELDRADARD